MNIFLLDISARLKKDPYPSMCPQHSIKHKGAINKSKNWLRTKVAGMYFVPF